MVKYRLCFAKHGPAVYIGHLDLLRLLQRAVNRAGLPIAYSAGFNPHQLVSFALPLPIGYESAAEYADLSFVTDPGDICAPLAGQLPDGLVPVCARKLADTEPTAAAATAAALYEITLPAPIGLPELADAVLGADTITVLKKTKSGEAEADIRKDIHRLNADSATVLTAMLAAGSERNLKPSLLVEYIYTLAQTAYDPLGVKYKRIEMFRRADGFVPLKAGAD